MFYGNAETLQLLVFKQFRTENRYIVFLELPWSDAHRYALRDRPLGPMDGQSGLAVNVNEILLRLSHRQPSGVSSFGTALRFTQFQTQDRCAALLELLLSLSARTG